MIEARTVLLSYFSYIDVLIGYRTVFHINTAIVMNWHTYWTSYIVDCG